MGHLTPPKLFPASMRAGAKDDAIPWLIRRTHSAWRSRQGSSGGCPSQRFLSARACPQTGALISKPAQMPVLAPAY